MFGYNFLFQIVSVRGCRVPICVVGNKSDIPAEGRQISKEIAEGIAALEWECGYVECSAKDNVGIIEVFKELLVQAKIRYNLSPAVRRRRMSLPTMSTQNQNKTTAQNKYSLKRHSCTVA